MAIRNAGESADMKAITLNKLTAKRKVKCLEIPHYAQPRPLVDITGWAEEEKDPPARILRKKKARRRA